MAPRTKKAAKKQSKAKGKSARAKKDGPHPALPCTICGYERKFTGYATKIGKNGKEAKWPTYEECPNKSDASLHPNPRNRVSPVKPVYQGTASLDGLSGVLVRVTKSLPKVGHEVANAYQSVTGVLPENITINMNAEDAKEWGVGGKGFPCKVAKIDLERGLALISEG